ncbi:MAG: serine/threonine-protein kinase [Vicinamibacterales bacterium]
MMKCPTCGASFGASQRLCPKDGAVLEPVESREDKLIGTILDGKYRLDSFLSRGGMGAVFRGTHVMLGRPVAVKMINPDLVTSSEIVRRFQREARAATQLQHPNIVDVYDLGQTPDGTLYIVMELVSGASLKDAIRTSGSVEPARIVRILGEVCDGLAQAHRRKIIHRDLKPQNIMLTVDASGAETAKIVDFGIAKTFEPDANTQLTAMGSTLGTPHYMSPEQATGNVVDGRSDIYSLGIILYEMLTGEVPFTDPSLPSVLVKHMTEPPQPPSLRRPDLSVPPALEAIALRCLAKDPAQRFENVEAMGAALRRAVPARDVDQTTIALGVSGPAATDAPTIPLSAAAAAARLHSAPTLVAAAAPAPPPVVTAASIATPPLPAPTVHATPAPGTNPTVAAPAPPPPAGMPHATPVRRSTGPLLAVVSLAVIMAAGTAYYMLVLRGADAGTSAQQQAAPPPQASPAAAEAPPSGTADLSAAPGAPSLVGAAPSSSARAADRSIDADARSHNPASGAGSAAPPRKTATASTGSQRAVAPSAPPSTGAAARPAPALAPAAAPQLPATPSVSFVCTGPSEICSPLRAAMQETLAREGLSLVRTGADIALTGRVEVLEERIDRQFGTMMAVRTYTIDIEGDAPRMNDSIPMPSAQMVSADARLGAERFAEAARLAASGAVERVKQYAAKKRQ